MVTAFTIQASSEKGVDYVKLIERFGCYSFPPELIKQMEELTGRDKLHTFIRRQIFFCHRDMELCLADYAKGKPFYLYTGRGPSAEALHLGHAIPFIMT